VLVELASGLTTGKAAAAAAHAAQLAYGAMNPDDLERWAAASFPVRIGQPSPERFSTLVGIAPVVVRDGGSPRSRQERRPPSPAGDEATASEVPSAAPQGAVIKPSGVTERSRAKSVAGRETSVGDRRARVRVSGAASASRRLPEGFGDGASVQRLCVAAREHLHHRAEVTPLTCENAVG